LLKILIEARPGAGKTTAARLIVDVLRSSGGAVSGITTEEIRAGGARRGFAIEGISTGERAVLAHVDRPGPPAVGRYGVDVDALERIALPELSTDAGVIVIDELGKMELASDSFCDAVAALFEKDVSVVATVHAFKHPFTDELKGRADIELIRLSKANRDALPDEIAGRLLNDRT
jgi:nucleoside-triphosphatase